MNDSISTITPQIEDLGEFSVRRLLPQPSRQAVGPWVFFDHFGPVDFPPGPGINVRPHPHINLATVTYLFQGEVLHRDSLGSVQVIRPGDINLMVAGRGIVHSERETAEARRAQRSMHGLQLWLALPEEAEEVEPSFRHYAAAAIPTAEVDGVAVRVMMGRAYGQESPVETFSPTLYLEARLGPGQTLRLPNGVEELGLYVVAGEIAADGGRVSAGTMLVLPGRAEVAVTAERDSIVVLTGGDPVGPRHLWWNFVSSREARIEEARAAWREGRFPPVPGDDKEFIPLPDEA
jgi:redox-sensitive bicupin YhaK (pirin superfamily)